LFGNFVLEFRRATAFLFMNIPKQSKRFCLVLIKPSHYDEDGYVIQWFRSAIPANSLACLYGLALECREQKVLGEETKLEIHAFDETNTNIKIKNIVSLIENADDGIVMLVGVQSNQFPRALDIAKPLREKGIKVAIGGFHVSGTMAMLKERDPRVQKALDLGVTIFAGEAEGRFAQVLTDAFENKLPEIYNFMNDLPNIENVATPLLPAERVHLTAGRRRVSMPDEAARLPVHSAQLSMSKAENRAAVHPPTSKN
jgi:hypothetical protein